LSLPTTTRFGRNPLLELELANKAYVDSQVGSGNTFARIVKTVDETINSDTTLHNDNEIFFVPNINKVYGWSMLGYVSSEAAADYKYSWSLPAGCTGTMSSSSIDGSQTRGSVDADATDSIATSVNLNSVARWEGRFSMGATPGTIQYTWAQLASNAGDTTLGHGTKFVVWEEV